MSAINVEVVIPRAGDCPHRGRALDWVLGRYAAEHPDWTVTLAATSADPWCKAAAINPAIARSTADIIVVADGDVWTDGLGNAVDQVVAGAPWAIPHRSVVRLDERGTAAVLDGEPWERQPRAERGYLGVAGGGFVIARREALVDVSLDARFVGWGQEDESWALALTALAGAPWRGKAPLVHLWHPPQQRWSRRWGSPASRELRARYLIAQNDPAAMRALIEEARHAALHADQPSVHPAAA